MHTTYTATVWLWCLVHGYLGSTLYNSLGFWQLINTTSCWWTSSNWDKIYCSHPKGRINLSMVHNKEAIILPRHDTGSSNVWSALQAIVWVFFVLPLTPYPGSHVTVTGEPNRITPLIVVVAWGIPSGTRHGFPETNSSNLNYFYISLTCLTDLEHRTRHSNNQIQTMKQNIYNQNILTKKQHYNT